MSLITTGIINVYKPQEWTSHDCVAIMRRVLGLKRVGHTGTLDPMATGVLPICAGPAARVMEYLDLDFKTYECEMQLGLTSDTLDIWGKVVPYGIDIDSVQWADEEADGKGYGALYKKGQTADIPAPKATEAALASLTEEKIRAAFEPYKGTIKQIPPKYSAIKIDGRKLYQYARSGEQVEIPTREVYIRDIEVLSVDLAEKKVKWKVECSKGTYIRSICRDIGEDLGCGAVMTELTRTASGAFSIENAVDIRELRDMAPEDIQRLVLEPDFPLLHFGKAVLSPELSRDFCNGHHIRMQDIELEREPFYKDREPHIPVRDEFRVAYNMYGTMEGRENVFLGVAFFSSKYKKLVADKVFYRG